VTQDDDFLKPLQDIGTEYHSTGKQPLAPFSLYLAPAFQYPAAAQCNPPQSLNELLAIAARGGIVARPLPAVVELSLKFV